MKKTKKFLTSFFAKPEYVFVVPALVFSVISAVLMPQLIVNDENMHFIRSYQLTELGVKHNCKIPVDIKERGFYAMYATTSPDYHFNNKVVDQSNQIDTDCGSATAYNPVLHLPQVVGVEIAKIVWPTTGGMILLGRLVNALVYCLGMFYIIRKARVGKWVLATIGLLPMMIHMAGSLSGDVINNLVIIGFITYLFNLFTQKKMMSKKQVLVLFVLSTLLAVTKLPYLLLFLLILFLPRRVLPTVQLKNKRIPDAALRIGIVAICGVLAVGMLTAWSIIYQTPAGSELAQSNPVKERPYLFLDILFNTYINPFTILGGQVYGDWLLRGVFGSFASFRYHLPYSIVGILAGLLVLVALKKNPTEETLIKPVKKTLTTSTLAALLFVIAAMTYGLYIAWAIQSIGIGPGAKFALGLQGRYFTPLLPLLIPLFVYVRRYISVNIKSDITTGVLVFSVMSASLVYYVVYTIRYCIELGLIG